MTVDKRSSSSLAVYGHPAVGSDETYIYFDGKSNLTCFGKEKYVARYYDFRRN